MNPIETYLSEKKAEKTAGPFLQGLREGVSGGGAAEFGKTIGSKGLSGALTVGGGLAAAGAGVAAQKLYDAATKARDFRSMLEANPDLAQHHEEQPRLFNQMFSTLRTFNPSFSKDPLVAGNYMRQMMEDPVHAGGKVVETLDYRDKMRSPLMSAFGGGKKSK